MILRRKVCIFNLSPQSFSKYVSLEIFKMKRTLEVRNEKPTRGVLHEILHLEMYCRMNQQMLLHSSAKRKLAPLAICAFALPPHLSTMPMVPITDYSSNV
jgi:hypothetical protein